MPMSRLPLRLLSIPALCLGSSLPASGQAPARSDPPAGPQGTAIDADRVEKIQGVIVRIEPSPDGGKTPARIALNTAITWQDFVRDQTVNPSQVDGTTRLPQGTNAVATKGQPATPNTLFQLTTTSQTAIEGRYRSATDESSRGGVTPEAAAVAESSPEASPPPGGSPRPAPNKVARLALQDLKPGLWIEVNAMADPKKPNTGEARRITVLRPVGGPDTPAAASQPER